MSHVFTCTGRRRPVEKFVAYFKDLERTGQVQILGINQRTRKVAFWKYEELKIMFNSEKNSFEIDRKLLKSVDFASLKPMESVIIKLSTFKKEDAWLKGSIVALSGPFQTRGGQLTIQEEIEEVNAYKKNRQCHVILSGPKKLADSYRDLLVREKVADPATVEYVF